MMRFVAQSICFTNYVNVKIQIFIKPLKVCVATILSTAGANFGSQHYNRIRIIIGWFIRRADYIIDRSTVIITSLILYHICCS